MATKNCPLCTGEMKEFSHGWICTLCGKSMKKTDETNIERIPEYHCEMCGSQSFKDRGEKLECATCGTMIQKLKT